MEGSNKRPHGESNSYESNDQHEPNGAKRMRPNEAEPDLRQFRLLQPNIDSGDEPEPRRSRQTPTFISVIRGAMIAETIRGICSTLEPVVRRAVREEVQNFLIGTLPLYGNRQYYIENPQLTPQDPRLKFVFVNQVSKETFTFNEIMDDSKNPIQIQLVNIETGAICPNDEGSSAKARIVVIDGDLEEEGCDSNKFNSNIVRPRDGKPALLNGNTIITLKRGVGKLEGLSFTDNSRSVRSGKFRLGICVDLGTCASTSTNIVNGIKIKEGLSDKFVVKDHRSELNKKHYPPILCLQDETWRLENIAREGKYHIRLKENGINNVQDFLRKCFANLDDLQNNILKMPKNAWEKLKNHAIQCPLGDDQYLFRSEENWIRLGSVGGILEVSIGGISYLYDDIPPQQMANAKQLAHQAYQQWDRLEKVSTHFLRNGPTSEASSSLVKPNIVHLKSFDSSSTFGNLSDLT
ncbi:hypothetical protein LUZ60_013658 [Juncus effusus]|nr:hypothetical protein LUZ60_013658 [Juncus effusus]